MSQKIVVGPFSRGFRNDIPPFYVDNDSFPTLVNAYQWRARVKRKRGTSPICRLQRFFNSAISSYGVTTSFNLVAGAGNLLAGFNLQSSGNIVPGTVQFTDTTSGIVYTDPTEDGYLTPSGTGGLNTINYATGTIFINGAGTDTIAAATFNYYPGLPVMDIEDLNLSATQFPQTLAFDPMYSYQIVTVFPYYAYDVSFYKNPAATVYYPGYIAKANPTPVYWNGQNYQQFWSVNYENAIWATNGITVPFTNTNIGMQFKLITNISAVTPGPPAIATFAIGAGNGLVVGDFIFINELSTTGGTAVTGLNLQTGYVIAVNSGAGTVTVEFPYATLVGTGGAQAQGIMQYLTSNLAFPTKDGIRWYDGSPTSGTQFNPTFVQGAGWVNYAPPIYSAPSETTTIGDLPGGIYYLVGARMIIPYKDRLLFLGVVVQCTGSVPGQIAGIYYLQDTIVFSENGTPYYTASFTGNPITEGVTFFPILTPTVPQSTSLQGAIPAAYFSDVAGFGDYITAGYAQPITTVGYNQDVLIVGFTNRETKIVYTGNDLAPFNFYIINSELGATATFSTIVLDRGVMSIGDRGITITDQQSSSRIDQEILDYIFEFNLLNNGTERITAQRDFVNEWVYFTYPYGNKENTSVPYPNQTLFYNYRDQSWAVFNESYTTYGPFRRQSGFTWQTVGLIFPSWNQWNQSWNSSGSSLEQPEVIAGNQQGFVVARRSDTTGEAPSLTITAVNTSTSTVTSPNHGLNSGDFVYFLNALGLSNFNSYTSLSATITGATQASSAVLTANNTFEVGDQIVITGVMGMTQLNGNTYTITAVTPTTITIDVNSTGFTPYSSGGVATSVPFYIVWEISVVDVNNFMIMSSPFLSPPLPPVSGTYRGNGTITRLYIPQIASKQFPTAWGLSRKTRIGVQQYLFTKTNNAQITLLIFLSQNSAQPFNNPEYPKSSQIVPSSSSANNALIYSSVLYTCPESTNLGLTPANTNLQELNLIDGTTSSNSQQQIWHRQNQSLIGDTVQVEFTLNEEQMFDPTLTNQTAEIECNGIIIDVTPSSILS